MEQKDKAVENLEDALEQARAFNRTQPEIDKAVGSENWPIWDVLLKLNLQLGIGSFAKLLTRFQEGLQVARAAREEDCPPESLKYLKVLKQL